MKFILSSFKWLFLSSLVILSLILSACSSSNTNTTTPTPTASPSSTPTQSATTPSVVITTTIPSPSSTPTATPSSTGQPVTINLAAQNMAFDTSTLTVPAGAQVTLVFTNKDSGIPHNFSLYTDSSASKTIFKGDIINGVNTITYKFTAPSAPGTYFFLCDLHPALMTGDFVVTAN